MTKAIAFNVKDLNRKMLRRFKFGIHLILAVQVALFFLCSCRTASMSSRVSNEGSSIEQADVSVIADKVWDYACSHPKGFTLNIRTMTEPKEGIAVSYAATQNSHSREQLGKVVAHALQNDGYVGGWYNDEDSLYYFDSSRLFPENALDEALLFGKKNGQQAVFVLSSSKEIPVAQEHSPNVFLVMYDAAVGKEPLLEAIKEYRCEVVYDYKIINGMALKKPKAKSLEETMQYFRGVKGVLAVEYDRITRLTDPVKPRLEIK